MKNLLLSPLFLLLFAVIVNLSYGCEDIRRFFGNEDNCVCTESFDSLTVKIKKNEIPVTNLSLMVSNAQTGKLYTNIEQKNSINEGRYVYFNDIYVSELTTNVTTLVVEGFLSNQKQFSEIYEVNTDICSCHVQKVSGKDEIVLKNN